MARRYRITVRCSGCGLCAEACVVDAIDETQGLPFRIDEALCVRCGECVPACPLGAVEVLASADQPTATAG